MTLHRKILDGTYVHMDALPDHQRATHYQESAALGEIVKCDCCGAFEFARDVRMHLRMGRSVPAKMPLDGPNHNFPCPRHTKTPEVLAVRGYSGGAIKQDRNGVKTLRPAFQVFQARLALPSEGSSDLYAPPLLGRAKPLQSSVSLLGLECLLLEGACHHVHNPQQLMDSYSRWALVRNAAMHVRFPQLPPGLDAHGTRWNLANILLLPTDADGRWRSNNKAILHKAGKFAPLAIAHLRAEDLKVCDGHLDLSHLFGVPTVMPRVTYEDACSRFRSGKAALDRGFSVVAMLLLGVEVQGDVRRAVVHRMVMMPITENGVPVSSLLERQYFAELELLGRRFRTNLIYDENEYDRKRPDGWLMDVGGDSPVEVFGMDDPVYVARMRAKIECGIAKYGDLFNYWEALSEDLDQTIRRLPRCA